MSKYGSIHIRTENFQTAAKVAAELLGEQVDEFHAIAQQFEQASKHPLIQGLTESDQLALLGLAESYREQAGELESELFAITTGTWFSLYSRELSFQTIVSKAAAFSQKLPDLIVYTSNFDDDVFVWGMIEKEKDITSGQICECPEIYGLLTKAADMDVARRVLGNGADIPAEMPTDIYDFETVLSDAIGIPLNIFEEFVCDDPEHYEKLDECYGIRVYRELKS